MQSLLAFVALLVLRPAVAAGENPLGQVIRLLDSLSAKITAEGEAEEKAYAAFMEWCDDAATSKKFELKTANTQKEKLEATIFKTKADAEASDSRIGELASALATSTKDLKDATLVRGKEAADFGAEEAELVDVIGTLGRAIALIEREMSKNPAAFTQVDSSNIQGLVKALGTIVDAASFSTADQKQLAALLQSRGTEDDDMSAPDPAAYKSHSSGILDVLEDLKEKAEEQLSALRKAETNAKHNYNMLKQSLEDETANNEKDFAAEKSSKAASLEENAKAAGDLVRTEKDIADGKAALQTAQTSCMTTAADHDATAAARKEELKVIAEAKDILSSSTPGAVDHTYSFLQSGGTSQSSLHTRADLAGAEVVTMVKALAKKMHSSALAQLASKINAVIRYGAGAGDDPFVKVRGLIRDMIEKLEAQAGTEATEKAYCDEQMAKTEAKKGELDFDLSKLTAKIDQAASESAALKQDVKELQGELASLTKMQAEMDLMRREQSAAFATAKSDLEAGLEGVRKALGMLREYYGSSPAALLQTRARQPAAPETHSKADGAGSSIIGILEVVESDFAKNLAKEQMQEEDSVTDYEKVSQENSVTKALKEQDVKYKTQSFKGLDKELAELGNDRSTASEELSAVMEYYSKLQERCIAKPETYEERAARRQAEVEGLKQALEIINSETAFTQRRKRGSAGRFHLRA